MEERRKVGLSAEEKADFERVAKVMDRLEVQYPSDVMFDSCDQYYVGFKHVAEALREME